jgi:ATP-dependent protease HslVU (ClpYQ) peptidase subunit
MTILAWDGKTLAADRQGSFGNFGREVTKIHRVPEGIMGFCGCLAAGVAMVEWFRGGRDPDEWPRVQGVKDREAYCMFIDWSGQLWIYEEFPHPMRIEGRFDAMGSGRDFALAAMHMGADAVTAVRVTCELATDCGMGVDALNLADARTAHQCEQIERLGLH